MLKIKTPVVNEVVLLLLWLIWNIYYIFSSVSMVDFEQVKVCWVPQHTLEISESLHWQLNLNLVHRSLNRGADQIK